MVTCLSSIVSWPKDGQQHNLCCCWSLSRSSDLLSTNLLSLLVEVDHLATHGFNCRKSESHHFRHTALNDTVHWALSSAKFPSWLETVGISCSILESDRKVLVYICTWERGRLRVWDATCSDPYAPSYITSAASEAGIVRSQEEERKIRKYDHLDASLQFTPVALETAGVFGLHTKSFLMSLDTGTGHPQEKRNHNSTSARESHWQFRMKIQPP